MKKYTLVIFTFCIFIMFSSGVIAEEKCSDSKINELKKQVDVVSVVSQYDEDGLASGIFNNNIVTVYGLPKGFYVINKSSSV